MPVVGGWLKPQQSENEKNVLHLNAPNVAVSSEALLTEPLVVKTLDDSYLYFPELELLEMNILGLPGQPGSMVSVHTESELATYLAKTTDAAVKAAEIITQKAGRADVKWDKLTARLVELLASYRRILVDVSENYLQEALQQWKICM